MTTESKQGESRRGNAGKGRRKGVPNKVTAALKDTILGALDRAGGEAYLARQADANPAAFLTLLGKVLPTQVTGSEGKELIPNPAYYNPPNLEGISQQAAAAAYLEFMHAEPFLPSAKRSR